MVSVKYSFAETIISLKYVKNTRDLAMRGFKDATFENIENGGWNYGISDRICIYITKGLH